MRIFRRKPRLPAVVLATQSPQALSGIPLDTFQTREAVSTMGVMSAMQSKPSLVIVDIDHLIESPEMSKETLMAALETAKEQGVIVIDAPTFNKDQQRWLGEALLVQGRDTAIQYMPRRIVMITNYCGGVGKTTISLTLARGFRYTTGLPAAVVEAGVGGSSIARLGKFPTLFSVVTQSVPPEKWEHVSVFPSDDWETRSLAGDQRTEDTLQQIIKSHTLVVFDTFPTNALWDTILDIVTDIVVIVSPRPDAIEQTDAVLRRLRDDLETNANRQESETPRIHIVMNQVQTVGQRIPLAKELSAWVPYDEDAASDLKGELAYPVLDLLYPERPKIRRESRKNKKS